MTTNPNITPNHPYFGKLKIYTYPCAACNQLIPDGDSAFYVHSTKKCYHSKCALSPTWKEPGSNHANAVEYAKKRQATNPVLPSTPTAGLSLSDLAQRVSTLENQVKLLMSIKAPMPVPRPEVKSYNPPQALVAPFFPQTPVMEFEDDGLDFPAYEDKEDISED